MDSDLYILTIQSGKIYFNGIAVETLSGQAWLDNRPLTIHKGQLLIDGVPLRMDAMVWLPSPHKA